MTDLEYAIAVLGQEAATCFDLTKKTALEIALQVLKGREVTFAAATPDGEGGLEFGDCSGESWAKGLEPPLTFGLMEDGKLIAVDCHGQCAYYPGKFRISWSTGVVMADIPTETCHSCDWFTWDGRCRNRKMKGIQWPFCDEWKPVEQSELELDLINNPDNPDPADFGLTPEEGQRLIQLLARAVSDMNAEQKDTVNAILDSLEDEGDAV